VWRPGLYGLDWRASSPWCAQAATGGPGSPAPGSPRGGEPRDRLTCPRCDQDTAQARSDDRLGGACGFSAGWFLRHADRRPARPGRYSFTDAVALISTRETVGGLFIVHLPPDLAKMASSLN
jgi:hypothetical protein